MILLGWDGVRSAKKARMVKRVDGEAWLWHTAGDRYELFLY